MLHTKVKHQSGWNVKPTLMQPATDAADQRTRDNLWYYMCVRRCAPLIIPLPRATDPRLPPPSDPSLSLDAHVSASSTWPGSIEETSTTVPIPGNFGATEPSVRRLSPSLTLFARSPLLTVGPLPGVTCTQSDARETAQTAISHDVFTRHPPGTTSFTLLVKSALLLRKVNTYIRLVDAAPPADPAQSAEFRSLDSLITTFRCVPVVRSLCSGASVADFPSRASACSMSFPPELRNPMRGNSVDVDLFAGASDCPRSAPPEVRPALTSPTCAALQPTATRSSAASSCTSALPSPRTTTTRPTAGSSPRPAACSASST